MKKSLSLDDEKRIENKLKALDLELTYGAHTHIASDAPPEIINQWLENVKRHEGRGICQLGWEEEEWLVQGINMPGFSF